MQQTKLDHWLRRKFVHETWVFCNTLPSGLDERFRVKEAAQGQPASHRYRVTPENDEALLDLVERFRMEGITYAATIQDKAGALASWIGRPGRSCTCEAVWFSALILGAGSLLYFLPIGKMFEAARAVLPF